MITSKQIGAVTIIDHDYSNGDNVGLMYLTSDLHIDSVYCNRDKLFADIRVTPHIHSPEYFDI